MGKQSQAEERQNWERRLINRTLLLFEKEIFVSDSQKLANQFGWIFSELSGLEWRWEEANFLFHRTVKNPALIGTGFWDVGVCGAR